APERDLFLSALAGAVILVVPFEHPNRRTCAAGVGGGSGSRRSPGWHHGHAARLGKESPIDLGNGRVEVHVPAGFRFGTRVGPIVERLLDADIDPPVALRQCCGECTSYRCGGRSSSSISVIGASCTTRPSRPSASSYAVQAWRMSVGCGTCG